MLLEFCKRSSILALTASIMVANSQSGAEIWPVTDWQEAKPETLRYDITSGYRSKPVPHVNERIGNILLTLIGG